MQSNYSISYFLLILFTGTSSYFTIWNFVDHTRVGAFPEEDYIRLAYIIGGNFMTRLMFMQHFKSVLKYSDHFFRLHLITDENHRSDIHELMTSWNISNCEWFFHNLTEFEKRVAWIPNSHYSKYYGLSKLLIPEIIGNDIGKIMFMDVDIIFQTNIFDLWKQFRNFNNSQVFGMVENLSDWYLNKDGKKSVWPALGRGFNTGIIMFDLDKLRKNGWASKWRVVANKYLRIHGKTAMSDQDIFNAYIHDYPTEIIQIPCAYNYQLGALTKSKELCPETPLALHFNSQNKTVGKNYAFFDKIRKAFDEMDGSDLKRRRRSFKGNNQKDICHEYLPLDNFRIIPNAIGRMTKPAELCMVTQFSKDRLNHFLESANAWRHPISTAVYGKDKDLLDIAKAVTELNRTDITIHLVFEEPTESWMLDSLYPINFLRNVAIEHANCKYILMTDVDFVVLGDYGTIIDQTGNLKQKEVLVIPALEMTYPQLRLNLSNFLSRKDLVIEHLLNKTIQTFRETIWPSSHVPTNISKWIKSNRTYMVNYEKNYEPYFVIKKEECPFYDQRFGGFGWNKVTHVMQLKMMNYKFLVSPTSFMIHQNHNASKSLKRWRRDPHYQKCLHTLKNKFMKKTASRLGIKLR
ncbi:Glycosyltransferase-like protein LARGE [Caenorhabditis elegans]|uniref:Glycosyltransferase-like protein LARGE n=1 Tax=Caenorhabditis elegans TaxID=6239 RepID=LGE1_CAEEL|nr:Glycosyltransferase-like protein LARGE [Caenorhabditis elegans]Q21389.3 RecName: Full=Glycosyltransferase-like protein LARGE [Caenorhabditis elegans]CAA91997.4 Glycosyltransferase-like protein LARGE [Caenorhabditis elegans]|eukprot:NP_509833.3 Glycosyltransferase-like protein LARGE [Caenorhabditis elegans]